MTSSPFFFFNSWYGVRKLIFPALYNFTALEYSPFNKASSKFVEDQSQVKQTETVDLLFLYVAGSRLLDQLQQHLEHTTTPQL